MWQDCFVISFSCKLNRSDEREPHAGTPSLAIRIYLGLLRLLHKGESLCCFRDSASVTYRGMPPSDLTLSALRFILSAKSGQSCLQDCETVDFCNSLLLLLCAL